MTDDDKLRSCVQALWALLEAARDGDPALVAAAARSAMVAVETARGGDNYLLLHAVDGALHLSGRKLPLGVDVFRPAHEIVRLLRDHDISEVLFDQDTDGDALTAWALGCAGGEDAVAAVFGVTTGARSAEVEPFVPLRGCEPVRDESDSRLRSTFLQHHLITAFTNQSAIPPHIGRVTLGAVVDRLLAIRGGMDPLTLLQRDGALLHRSLHTAVIAVVFARVLGWPEARLCDLGGAALLHDVGSALAPESSIRAGADWLLERGSDPFWLRCALVARNWRNDHGSRLADLGPDGSLAAAIVRLAVDAERGIAAGETPDELEASLATASAAGRYPHEMVQLAASSLRQMLAPV